MYYVVQDNVFRETNYNNLIYALERLDLPHEIVSVIPFEDSFRFDTKRTDVFPFGSVKMARVSKELGWNPGSQLNDNHDYMVYKDYYKDNLLNYDSKIIKFGDTDFFSKERFFARPTKDTKVFTGQEFDFGEWVEFRESALTNGHSTLLDSETEIQIASIKKIYKEIRIWIVKGEIVTASQYRLGNRLVLDSNVDKEAYTYCNNMVKLFELNDGFVMDLALTDNGYKIIECGCINCAGFYEADMQKLLMILEEKF